MKGIGTRLLETPNVIPGVKVDRGASAERDDEGKDNMTLRLSSRCKTVDAVRIRSV